MFVSLLLFRYNLFSSLIINFNIYCRTQYTSFPELHNEVFPHIYSATYQKHYRTDPCVGKIFYIYSIGPFEYSHRLKLFVPTPCNFGYFSTLMFNPAVNFQWSLLGSLCTIDSRNSSLKRFSQLISLSRMQLEQKILKIHCRIKIE